MDDDRDDRPDPDALLARLEAEQARAGRARLKIFFGAAPGVGKTYAMLQEARRAHADGEQVLVGVVETHGRRETEELLAGLPVLPRHLSRILVDELAHTNASGSKHVKRWQDVLDLLDAGVSVLTMHGQPRCGRRVRTKLTRVPTRPMAIMMSPSVSSTPNVARPTSAMVTGIAPMPPMSPYSTSSSELGCARRAVVMAVVRYGCIGRASLRSSLVPNLALTGEQEPIKKPSGSSPRRGRRAAEHAQGDRDAADRSATH